MLPAYGPGDWLLVRWGATIRPGDAVVARRGDGDLIIKRAVRRVEDGWWLEGENLAESVDSRRLGPFADDRVLARVLFRYRRNREGS
jgi:phage repressor protein C with HTH and peptisase S24 domain